RLWPGGSDRRPLPDRPARRPDPKGRKRQLAPCSHHQPDRHRRVRADHRLSGPFQHIQPGKLARQPLRLSPASPDPHCGLERLTPTLFNPGGPSMQLFTSPRGQAMPGPTRPLTSADLGPRPDTAVTWLGSAGIFLNSRGSTLMVDPLLQDFDMPLLIQPPIRPRQVPRLDALLITHIDNDHFSRSGCLDMKDACRSYHAPRYVAEQIAALGLPGTGHDIGETFQAGCISATLTPARHNWQNGSQKWSYRHWEEKDYCGYWFDTPDGSIWLPGDSQLLPSHLTMPQPDLILLDFSDN